MDKSFWTIFPVLAIVYAGDLLTTWMLDPSFVGFEQNPIVLWGQWPYAIATSLFMVFTLAWVFDWSYRNSHLLLPREKPKTTYFYWLLAGPGAAQRWAIVMARILPLAGVAMKAVLMVNNLLFFWLLNIASPAQNMSLKASLGLLTMNVYGFQRLLFVVMMGLMMLVGLGVFFWELRKIVRQNSGKLRVSAVPSKKTAKK